MSNPVPPPDARRPLKTRSAVWARRLAASLARRRIAPNAISLLSVVFALVGAAALVALASSEPWWLRVLLAVAAATAVQLRLLCNLLDGMVAVEGGLASPVGELYNEVPDRIADVLLLLALGVAATPSALPYGLALGVLAALLALLAAYVRALGVAVGAPQCFHGPMAKPQRMFALTLACLVAAALAGTAHWALAPWIALALIDLGAAVTVVRRLKRIAAHLRTHAENQA